MKHYVGCNAGTRTVFKAACDPTEETHGHLYSAVIGPFRTKRGAEFMALHGANNPHCQTVADAERLALSLIAEKAARILLGGRF